MSDFDCADFDHCAPEVFVVRAIADARIISAYRCNICQQCFFTIKLGFFSLFPYRILLILAGFLFIAEMLKGSQHLEKWKQVHVKGILMFFTFWFCYGMISLLWVKSATEGVKYLFLLAMGMFLFF